MSWLAVQVTCSPPEQHTSHTHPLPNTLMAAFFRLRCSPSMEPKLCSTSASSSPEGLVVRAGAREEKYSPWLYTPPP